jgi:hypothetical protein
MSRHATPRVILIGGTSHCGKSTLAAHLAARVGADARSTDHLARHPGRPWTFPDGPPPHVAEYYLAGDHENRLALVLAHYDQTVWPLAEALIRQPSTAPLVLEGSALLPDRVSRLGMRSVGALWLTAAPGLLEQRIRHAAALVGAAGDVQAMTEAFLERALRFDRLVYERATAACLPLLTVTAELGLEDLADRARAALSSAA